MGLKSQNGTFKFAILLDSGHAGDEHVPLEEFFIIFSKFNVHRHENLMYRNELNGLRLDKLNKFKKRLGLISK